MALLEVNHLNISFGGLHAVDDFHVSIEKGQLYGLIGPNGAGKTTIFNLLTGVYKPDEGIINLDGQDITGKSTIDINKAGIARTFQNIRLFKALPVLDNFLDAAYMGNLPNARIIHGKGTGALRKAVHASLRRNKAVKGFRLGNYGEGESGVTVVELK